MVSLFALDQVLLAKEAQPPFLKNLDFIKDYIATKANDDTSVNDEEDNTDTIINKEDQGNRNNEVPGHNIPIGETSEFPISFTKKLSRLLQITQDQGKELSNPKGANSQADF